MADQATFHAKISADAREFIAQIENAGEAVKGLVTSTSQLGNVKAPGGGSEGTAKQAESEMRRLQQEAMASSDQIAEKNKQNIEAEAAARTAAANRVADVEETREEQIQRLMSAGITRIMAERMAGQKRLGVDMTKLSKEEREIYKSILRYQNTIAENDIKRRNEITKAHGVARRMNEAFDRRREIEQAKAVAQEQRRINDAMVTGRYALYDMANTYRGIYNAARQVTQFLSQGVVEAAKFETSFTAVERALQLDVDSAIFTELKDSLTDLSTQIPVTFGELSQIATLGAQMGIAAQDITAFTQTVASFSSITGVTIENTAEKFGRLASLANVPAAEFENLGSAVYFAGINAVATEEQILSMAEQIAATGTKAGFSAAQIIGLSTALASVGLQPELSRGALMRIFDFMDRSVAGLTGKLDELAVVMGMTQQQAAQLFAENPEQFFNSFLKGLGTIDNLTAAFDKLGLVNVRDRDLLTRLSQNMDVYTQSMQDANQSYAEGTALSEGYGRQADNLESMIARLNNAVAALGAALGESTLQGLKPFIQFTIDALNAARDFAATPFGQVLLPLAIGLTSAVGLFAAFVVGTSLAKASVLAMNIAMQKMAQLNGQVSFSIRDMIQTLTGQTYVMALSTGQMRVYTKAQLDAALAAGTLTAAQHQAALASSTATAATRGLTIALRALSFASIIGIGVTVVGILAEMTGAFGTSEESMQRLGDSAIQAAGGIEKFQDALARDKANRERATALQNLTGEQENYNLALEKSIELYRAYSGRETDANASDDAAAEQAATEYAKVIYESLRSYNDGIDFFAQLATIKPEDKALLEALGFDAMEMVNAGIAKNGGAAEYVKTFSRILDGLGTEAMRAVQGIIVYDDLRPAEVQFDNVISRLEKVNALTPAMKAALTDAFNASGLSAYEFFQVLERTQIQAGDFNFLNDAAASVDGVTVAVQTADAADREFADGLKQTEEQAGNTSLKLGEITDEVKTLIDQLFAADFADIDLASSFDEFAAGVLEAGNELSVYTETGRQNLENFKGFIDSALAEAEASGTGVVGALQNIGNGLAAMEAKGIDVTTMMGTFRQVVVQSLYEAAMAGGTSTASLALLAAEIEGMPPGTTLDVILQKLFGITGAATAAAGALHYMGGGAYDATLGTYVPGVTAAADATFDFGAILDSVMGSMDKAFGGGGSSVSKAKDEIEELGEETTVAADKLNDLGKSIEENGLEFDRWSQTGSQNVMALMAVIESMRVEAGGDVQMLANWLAALREALIRAGASASAVAIINAEIAKLGVTATATAQDIDAMYAALTQQATQSAESVKKSTNKTRKEFMRLSEAISKVASDIGKNLDTLFGKERAIDAITMGWLDLKDGADKARESISDAEEQISDIQMTIDETRASIEGLAADKSKLEYQLSIALKYGDAIRAQEIQAELAKLDAQIAQEQDKIADSQAEIAKAEEEIRKAQSQLGIDSTVEDIIERNRALEDMAELYGELAAALMVEAKTQEDRKDIIEAQTAAFYANAIAAGFTAEEAQRVADALALSMSQVDIPRNIKDPFFGAGFDTSQAKDSIDEFVNWANERLASLTENFNLGEGYQMPDFNWLRPGGFTDGGGGGRGDSDGDRVPTRPSGRPGDEVSTAILDDIRMRASAAVQIGLDYFSPTNLMKPAFGKTGAAIGTGPQNVVITELSPQDRQLLRAALERPITLYADSTEIANTSNRGNTILARRNRR